MSRILFPHEVVYEDNLIRINQDRKVPIPGFFIVGVLLNVKSIDQLNQKEITTVMNSVHKLRMLMRDLLHINEVYLFQNEDSNHSFHIWLFPRYEWMEKFGNKIESVRDIINYAKLNMCSDDNFTKVKNAYNIIKQNWSQSKKSY